MRPVLRIPAIVSIVLATLATLVASLRADESTASPDPQTLRLLDRAIDDLLTVGVDPIEPLIRAEAAIRSHTVHYATTPFVAAREERMVRAIVPVALRIMGRPESDRQNVTYAVRAMDMVCGALSSPEARRLFEPHVEAIASLIRVRPHPGIHREAINWLRDLGGVSSPAFPTVVAVFEAESIDDARIAARALGSLGERSWPYLRLALTSESAGRRLLALRAWDEAPPLLVDDFVLLARTISDAEASVGRAAAGVVSGHATGDAISGDVRRAVTPLVRAHTSSPDVVVRRAAWYALAGLAPAEPPLDPKAIGDGLADLEWTVRRAVVLALRRIVPSGVVVGLLTKSATDSDFRVCASAASELAALGSAAEGSIPTLVALAERERRCGSLTGVHDVEAAIEKITKSTRSPK